MGSIKIGDEFTLAIDQDRRRKIMANHTATHVLNNSLRKVLGPDADQKGSLVESDKMRFDFSARKALTAEQVRDAEQFTRETIAAALPVRAWTLSRHSAVCVRGCVCVRVWLGGTCASMRVCVSAAVGMCMCACVRMSVCLHWCVYVHVCVRVFLCVSLFLCVHGCKRDGCWRWRTFGCVCAKACR